MIALEPECAKSLAQKSAHALLDVWVTPRAQVSL
jgi:hypothetical protein